MLRLLKYTAIFLLIFSFILIAAAAFLQFADLNPYRPKIESMASHALSRQLHLNGPMEIRLFPDPEIVLNDVTLNNASWGSEPEMVTVGSLGLSVRLSSLFSDMIIVKNATLKDVALLLEKNAEQKGNWILGKDETSIKTEDEDAERKREKKNTSKKISLPLMADLVALDNISLTLRGPGEKDRIFHLERFRWKADESGNVQLNGSGKLVGNALDLNGIVTSLESLKRLEAVKLEMDASVGDVDLSANINTGRMETLADLEGDLHFTAPDIQQSLKRYGIDVPLTGRITGDLNASQNPLGFDLTGSAKLGGITAEGMAAVVGLSVAKGTLRLKIDEIDDLLKAFKIGLPISGPLTADARFMDEEDTVKATVEAKVSELTATIDCSYRDSRLNIASTITPLRRLGEWFDLKGLSNEALHVKADLTQSGADEFDVKSFQANVVESQLAFKGVVKPNGTSNISFDMESPNLKSVLSTLPAIYGKAKGNVEYSAEKLALTNLDANFDKSDLHGDFSMYMDNQQSIKAHLTSKLLDLRPFSQSSDEEKKTSSKPEDAGEKEAKKKTDTQYVIKKTPLPFLEPLENLSADADLSVDHLFYDTIDVKNVVVDASVHDGHLKAKAKLTTINGGKAAARIDLTSKNNHATVDTLVSISDLRVGIFENKGVSREEVPPLSVSAELKTSGGSPRDLAAVANGRILVTQGSGRVVSNALGMISGDIFTRLGQTLNPFSKTEPFTDWDCSVLSMQIKDGQVEIEEFLAQGEKVMVIGGGHIDLKTEVMTIEFNTKPRTGIGITPDMFVTPYVNLEGTMASPGLGLNEKSTLLAGGAALATGGLSIIAQTAINRAKGQIDHCEETMEQAGKHIRYDF